MASTETDVKSKHIEILFKRGDIVRANRDIGCILGVFRDPDCPDELIIRIQFARNLGRVVDTLFIDSSKAWMLDGWEVVSSNEFIQSAHEVSNKITKEALQIIT